MPEDDDLRVGKPSAQPRRPPLGGAAVVNHRDAHLLDVELRALGQRVAQRVVVVAEHGAVGHLPSVERIEQ